MITVTLISQIAIALILFGGFFYFLYKPGKGVSKEVPRIVFFSMVFFAGLILNWLGNSRIYNEGHNPREIIKVGSAVITTLQMFVLNAGMDKIESLSMENTFYGIAFIICYIAAVICTVVFAVHIFFKSFWNVISLFFVKLLSKKIWIIVGKGIHQETLLKSLTAEQKGNTIIIQNENNVEGKKKLMDQGFLAINGEFSIGILKKPRFVKSKEITLIAISDDDVENLEIARIITESLSVFSGSNPKKLKFSAHIMYTNIERVEHFKLSDNADGKIQFFNPYEITVRSFLFDNPITKFIPREYIDTENACLKRKFDFLHVFIGFGKINREFLKQSIAANQVLGMDYQALVIDKDIQDSQSAFMNYSRGVFAKEGEWSSKKYFSMPQEKYRIDFVERNALSKEMYDLVIERIKKVDASVVIVALGDVQLSAETAMEFRQQCNRENVKKGINIFVHAKRSSPIVNEKVLNADAEIKIKPFGFENAILTLDHIENRNMDILAKHIAVSYASASIKGQPEEMEELINQTWCQIGSFERESNLSAALSIRIKLNMIGFDLVDNSTKTEDAKEEFKEVYKFEEAQKLLEAKEIEHYKNGKIANTIRNNLARLEHQRWNTFHLVKGWTPMQKKMVSVDLRKNKATKEHACITTFEGLDELAKLQAKLKCKKDPNLDFQAAFKESDIMFYDCQQMDCLEGNLRDTNYKIVKWDGL
ncbi:hypothetical protein [Leadbettera azotonutricia]|uniref:hypothetical protein n=1 Tax=Leadbettera azotonutricia TaxID=150829 RepID=UPI000A05FA5D|nr:hypothetical protein [Leadbettera azotonutricia]